MALVARDSVGASSAHKFVDRCACIGICVRRVYVCVCLLFQQLFPLPVVQLSLLIVSMSTLQLLLQYLMSRSSRENLLASALSGGVLLAVLLFQVPQVHEWLPSWELGDCLPPFDHFIAGGMAVLVIGAIIAQWEPSQQVRNENWQGTPLGMMRIATNCTAASLFSDSAPDSLAGCAVFLLPTCLCCAQPMDLDVWARMEEIAHREEIDAARRAAKRNRR